MSGGALYPLRRALTSNPSPGNLATEIAKLEDLEIEFYAPRGVDPQTPHSRDELYVIARGSGGFELSGDRLQFETGDVLFVPAHAEHRFVDFTEDFATWVIFYGPEKDA